MTNPRDAELIERHVTVANPDGSTTEHTFWSDNNSFDPDAPVSELPEDQRHEFFATLPLPYSAL